MMLHGEARVSNAALFAIQISRVLKRRVFNGNVRRSVSAEIRRRNILHENRIRFQCHFARTFERTFRGKLLFTLRLELCVFVDSLAESGICDSFLLSARCVVGKI